LLSSNFDHPLHSVALLFGLTEMALKGIFECRRLCRLRHLRESFDQLRFRAIDVLECFDKQLMKRHSISYGSIRWFRLVRSERQSTADLRRPLQHLRLVEKQIQDQKN
jgi:hypothetical protein